MKLLVLDSSGLVASVALIEDDQLIAEYTTGNKLTHSQTLLPMLDEVIKRTSFEIEDIDAVAVAKGPGFNSSFFYRLWKISQGFYKCEDGENHKRNKKR